MYSHRGIQHLRNVFVIIYLLNTKESAIIWGSGNILSV